MGRGVLAGVLPAPHATPAHWPERVAVTGLPWEESGRSRSEAFHLSPVCVLVLTTPDAESPLRTSGTAPKGI